MIVLQSTYITDSATRELHLAAHLEWVGEGFSTKRFIAAGARSDSSGATILVRSATMDEVADLLAVDPFVIHGVATYEALEFEPGLVADDCHTING